MKKVQTLNEEIQKMRRLMSFNINENSHDSLSEENFNVSVGGGNTDPKQEECAQTYSGPSEIVNKMTNVLNGMLEAKLVEIQRQVKVKIVATGPTNVYVEMGDITLPLTQDKQFRTLFTFKESINIPFESDISLS